MVKWPWQNYILIISLVIIVLLALPMVLPMNISTAISLLEKNSYIVLASGEYELIAKEATAAAAAVKAELAVTTAESAVDAAEAAAEAAVTAAAKVDLFNSAEVFLFPDATSKYVLFASGDNNTWGDWAEIKDNLGVALSDNFTSKAGYISDVYLYDLTIADVLWNIEIAYADNISATKTSITRFMFNSEYMDLAQIKSRRVPEGKKLYYRMMCNTAPTEYVSVGFRYFFE